MTGIVQFDVFKLNNETPYKAIRIKGLTQGRGYIQLSECYMFSNDKIIRSLSGGCAYITAYGDKSLTNQNLGAWPSNNEYDTYIVNSDLNGKIIKGDDKIWHWNLWSYVKETSVNGVISTNGSTTANNTYRNIRGRTGVNVFEIGVSTMISASGGFRPVLNYIESDIASEVIY
jgi:hypothetical protein